MEIQELRNQVDAKRLELKAKLDSYPKKKLADGGEAPDIPANDLEGIRKMNADLNELSIQLELATAEERVKKSIEFADQPDRGFLPASKDGRQETKSIGELFTAKAYGDNGRIRKEVGVELDIDTKTLFQRSTGYAPESVRSGRVVLSAQRPPQVIDAIPVGTINQAASVYMRETTFTNAADITAEGAQYPEAALSLTQVSNTVQKIAVFLPVTDEQLEDVEGIQSYINNRLELMLMQRLDFKLINGAGGGSDLEGFLNVSGIQTQARGADDQLDALFKAATKVRSTPGFANPTAFFMNPVDWQNIRLKRTSDGVYIMGNPADVAAMRVWGLPVIETVVLASGTALVGDWNGYTQFSLKRGVTVTVTNSNEDDFKKGRQCIRADMRGVLDTYRPSAICSITGL
jgi:HK97 family phage major capsid protein